VANRLCIALHWQYKRKIRVGKYKVESQLIRAKKRAVGTRQRINDADLPFGAPLSFFSAATFAIFMVFI
jgi:hypothetical protein